MFANTRTPGGSGNLLEFKAGRTLLEPGSAPDKRKAVADKSKGLVFIRQSNDQLMHFCWKNRDKNTTDLDLIIFPGDTEFVRIKECTESRVYMLKFKSSEDHKLFWLQEARTDKDDDYCKKVNELLNNPPASRARGGADRSGSANPLATLNSAIAAGADEIGALGNMDQQQIVQLLSLMGGGNDLIPQLVNANQGGSNFSETPKTRKERAEAPAASIATPTSTAGGAKFDTAMLNQIISSLPSTSEGGKHQVELSKVLTRANVEDFVKANAETLSPHLPTTDEPQEINQTIGSPQFQQAADFFGSALSSRQLGPALRHFDLEENVIKAADSGDLLLFSKELAKSQSDSKDLDAKINEEAKEDEEGTAEAASKKPKDEDNMDLD